MKRQNRQVGFSTVGAVITAVAIAAIGTAGFFAYQHNQVKPTGATANTQITYQHSNQQTTTAPLAATPATYTSTAGGFSFTYPAGWKVTEQPPIPGIDSDDQISIAPPAPANNRPTVGRTTNTDTFTMTFLISSNPDVSPRGTISAGTTQEFANGINLWTSGNELATRPTNSAGRTVCPELAIVNADGSHFSYALSNGQNLALIAGYCIGQNDTTKLSYQAQLNSADWKAAVGIIQSIQFN